MVYLFIFNGTFYRSSFYSFFINHTATTVIYTLSLHDALPISLLNPATLAWASTGANKFDVYDEEGWTLRSEEHTSELQSLRHLVCRLLLEKKKIRIYPSMDFDLGAPRDVGRARSRPLDMQRLF